MARFTRLKDYWLHHWGETLLLQRCAVAKGYGLKPEDYVTPLPGTSDNSVTTNYYGVPAPVQPAAAPMPPASASNSKLAWLPWALLALTGIAGAGAGGYLLHSAAMPQPAAVQTPVPAKAQEIEVKWKQGKDGKWAPTVTPVPVEP